MSHGNHHARSGRPRADSVDGDRGEPLREPEPDTVGRAQRGDADAFEELVRMYLSDVHRFVLRIVRHVQTAEDVTQDAFVKAYVALPRFRSDAKFSTWLFGIAHNCAVDAIRKSSRQQRLVAASTTQRPASDPGVGLMINAAMDGLPDDLRRAFTLVEVFGFTYPEASTILDWPIGTLKSRMHRARRLLIDALSADDADEM